MKFKSSQIKNPYSVNYTFDVFKKLLTRLLDNIKADRAVLVLTGKEGLEIEAEAIQSSKGIVAKSVFQLKSQNDKRALLPEIVLNKALKEAGQLIIDHPIQKEEYASDPYFKQVQPSFVFCSPVFAGSSIEGLLYLESQKELPLDESERFTLLSLWADQASLSLENTKWFLVLQEDLKDRMHEISAVKKENKARIQFLADMNHEVMSPLNSIVGFSELLMKKDLQHHFPPEVKRYLENIQSSGNKLVELLDNVLEYSRVDSGSVELIKENIDLRMLLNSVYLASRQLLNSHGASLKIELDEQCPNTIFSDRSLLTKILMTLVRFSIHRFKGEIPILLKAKEVKSKLQISLSFSGKPFPVQDQKDLFSAFAHIKQEMAPQEGDVDDNLALATSKQMIDRLQGEINYLVSGDDKANIIIELPYRNSESINDVMAAWKLDTSFSGEFRVLLLEDHLSNWDLLANILKDLGLKTMVEPASPASLPKLTVSRPHLMFLDMHMPGMDEKAKIFIRHLRTTSELKHVPLVALTTDRYHCKYQSDYKSVGVEFLIKPFGVGDIVRVIKKYQNDLIVDETEILISEKKPAVSNSAKVLDKRSVQELSLNQVIIKELEELTQIPIFKGGTIINRLNQIKEEHVSSSPYYPVLIGNLKSAVFEGDGERFITIIKKAIEKNS